LARVTVSCFGRGLSLVASKQASMEMNLPPPIIEPITFEVLGDPKAQPRPKAFARKFNNGAVMARVYTPGTAEEWKGRIALAAKEYVPFIPFTGPIRLDIQFRFKRPQSHFLKRGLRENAPFFHTGKPDRDNLEKAVADSLTVLGMWKDDGQVCCGEVIKIYSDLAGATITITPFNEPLEQVRPNGKQAALAI